MNGREEDAILDMENWRKLAGELDWKTFIERSEEEAAMKSLRLNTNRGRPLGSDSFLSKLEKTLGRRVRPLPPHRPRKEEAKKG